MGCIDADLILDFVQGFASPAERARIEGHIDACAECRLVVAGLASHPSASAREPLPSVAGEPTLVEPGGRAVALQLGAGDSIDHFRIMRLIARGGMGEVYLARDTRLGRRVALKLVRRALGGTHEILARFEREAQATAKLGHPNIVGIYGVGDHQGTPYVALEYVDGQTLAERIRERPPSVAESLRVCAAIAEGLVHAHEHGVLHRDLKPANVIIDREGRVRVLDFGLAQIEGEPESFDEGIQGTPSYMAPEQWRAEAATGATDVWSLGVILHELVSGAPPFVARDAGALAKLVCGGPAPPALDERVPREIAELVAACLSREPASRPSAARVAEVLRETLLEGRRSRPDDESPFRGLYAFRERHADVFFGREPEIARAVERLRHEAVMPVVGPSGAGKSSFVQAGVVPRLREQERWHVLQLRPHGRPFAALAAALLQQDSDAGQVSALADALAQTPGQLALELRLLAEQHGAKVLLLVDQLEELFTLGHDDEIARRFLAAVCGAADDPLDPVRVVLTLRDDFLGRAAAAPELRAALSHVTVLHSPEARALADILEKPLAVVGYAYDDPALVAEMIASVAGEPASLPLLEFAAQVLWDERDKSRRLLLREAYQRLGGVAGALAKHADGVLAGFSPAELRVARELLLRLVTAERTRRVIARHKALEGLDEQVATEVLARLVAARLVTASQSPRAPEAMLELTHESLIRVWSTLAEWLDASHEELAFLAEIGQAAELWDKRGRRPEELWQEQGLRDALAARGRATTRVPALVQEFLGASEERSQRRARSRRVLVLGAVAVLAIVTVVLAVQRHEAEALRVRAEGDRAQAEQQRGHAEARRAEALLEGARAALEQRSVLEARAKLRTSLEIEDSPVARMLWWRLETDPLVWQRALGAVPYSVAWSPRGDTLAVACQDEAVYLFDVATVATRVLRGHRDQVRAVAFSPDGTRLASGSWDGDVRLWDVSSGAAASLLSGHDGGVAGVSFSPDGHRLASAGRDGSARLWDVATGRQERLLGGHEGALVDVTFSPNGELVATSGVDGTVRLWGANDGSPRHTLRGHEAAVWGLGFSPDGSRLASASRDATVRLWRVGDGQHERLLDAPVTGVFATGFSPDGRLLAIAGNDRVVQLWDASAGRLVQTLPGHDGGVSDLAFDPSGHRLASVADDGFVRVWELGAKSAAPAPTGHTAAVWGVDFSADGRTVVSGGRDETVRLWSVASGEQREVLAGCAHGVAAVAFAPTEDLVAAGCEDGTVRLWQLASGGAPRVLRGHEAGVAGVAFRPDGAVLASASRDKTVRLWEVASGAELAVLRGHAEGVYGVAFSPDGRQLASAGIDRTVTLWDVATGRAGRVLRGYDDASYGLAFSPDGATLAAGSFDRSLRLWRLSSEGDAPTQLQHPGRVHGVAFHPRGDRVGAAGSDGLARIWDIERASALVLRGHGDEVNGFAFSRDGAYAATSSDDGTVRVWDADSGRPHWRAPILLGSPPRLWSQRGWRLSDGGEAEPPAGWGARLSAALAGQARQALSSGALVCIARYDDRFELWDVAGDERVAEVALGSIAQLAPLADGCAVRAGGRVRVIARAGEPRDLGLEGAGALGVADGRLFVATEREIVAFDASLAPRARQPIGAGVSALALVEPDLLALGYRDGNLELRTLGAGGKMGVDFERTPSSAVRIIVPGPMGTLAGGFDDGTLAIWHRADGKTLARTHLHGPIVQLLFEGERLHAATDLGDALAWDLTALYRDDCALLASVWQRVPVVWAGGAAVLRTPPAEHRCRR